MGDLCIFYFFWLLTQCQSQARHVSLSLFVHHKTFWSPGLVLHYPFRTPTLRNLIFHLLSPSPMQLSKQILSETLRLVSTYRFLIISSAIYKYFNPALLMNFQEVGGSHGISFIRTQETVILKYYSKHLHLSKIFGWHCY